MEGVTIVVPCFNEEGAVRQTVEHIHKTLAPSSMPWETIFVNDGSRDKTGKILDELTATFPALKVVHNAHNFGYGASLKRGILSASYNRIVITDADGTYPIDDIPALIKGLDFADMVVGARIGKISQIPLARRPAKWLLLRYARALTRADIKDVNSGFRGVWIDHLRDVWPMLPDAFSFTSTLTIAMHIQKRNVQYIPISYFSRVGKSSIQPVRDTLRFFSLILRTVMYFKPLPVFGTFSLFLIVTAVVLGVVTKALMGYVADVTVVSLFETGLVFLGLGLLGDLINARRRY
jgi:glycosyltransferase involved in cell wall biosynthesis